MLAKNRFSIALSVYWGIRMFGRWGAATAAVQLLDETLLFSAASHIAASVLQAGSRNTRSGHPSARTLTPC